VFEKLWIFLRKTGKEGKQAMGCKGIEGGAGKMP